MQIHDGVMIQTLNWFQHLFNLMYKSFEFVFSNHKTFGICKRSSFRCGVEV